jgi:hypothetical protein
MPIEQALSKMRQEVDERVIRQVAEMKLAALPDDGAEANEY